MEFERETNDGDGLELVVIDGVPTAIGRNFGEVRLVTIAFVGGVSVHFRRELVTIRECGGREFRFGEIHSTIVRWSAGCKEPLQRFSALHKNILTPSPMSAVMHLSAPSAITLGAKQFYTNLIVLNVFPCRCTTTRRKLTT